MKRLILMRHAKSSWDNLDLSDHERTLNDRGRADCKLISKWMSDHDLSPSQVVCSTAERCKETCNTVFQHIGLTPEITFKRALYHASDTQILEQVQNLNHDTVMVFAHNPGSGSFANRILRTPPEHKKFYAYPTAATTVVDFDIEEWTQIRFETGKLNAFIIPSELR